MRLGTEAAFAGTFSLIFGVGAGAAGALGSFGAAEDARASGVSDLVLPTVVDGVLASFGAAEDERASGVSDLVLPTAVDGVLASFGAVEEGRVSGVSATPVLPLAVEGPAMFAAAMLSTDVLAASLAPGS